MTRTLMLVSLISAMTMFGSSASAAEPQATLPTPQPMVDLSAAASPNVDIVEVGNRRYRRGYRYGNPYPSYRYSNDYRPYGYYYGPYRYYYPRYYGAPRYGYYNYGYGRGAVRVGPVQVWW